MLIITISKTYLKALYMAGHQVSVSIQDAKIVLIKYCSNHNMIISFRCLHIWYNTTFILYSKVYMNQS